MAAVVAQARVSPLSAPLRCVADCCSRLAPGRATSTACSPTRSTSRSSSTRTARRGSSTTARRSSACPPTSGCDVRRDDGRPGRRCASTSARSYLYRLPRLRLRARLAEPDSPAAATTTDTPVVVYKIKSHFDIKREYNAGHRRADQRHLREHQRPPLEPAPVHARRLVAEPGRGEPTSGCRPSAVLRADARGHRTGTSSARATTR